MDDFETQEPEVAQTPKLDQGPLQFDLSAALNEYPLDAVVKELAQKQNFAYDAAKDFAIAERRKQLQDKGVAFSESEIAKYADEELLIELTGGQIIRSDFPKLRGAAEGIIVDVPTGIGMAKGAQIGYTKSMALPLPPAWKVPTVAASTIFGGLFGSAAGYIPGELAFNAFIGDEEVLPSQRPEMEAARTYSGTLASLVAFPMMIKQGAVNLGAEFMARNIDQMAAGGMKTFARAGQKTLSGLERLAEGVAKPFARPTTTGEALKTAAKATIVSGAPAAGAYIAEKYYPGDPLARFGFEVGFSAFPVGRVVNTLTAGAARKFAEVLGSLSTQGRERAASERIFNAIESIKQKHNLSTPEGLQGYKEELEQLLTNKDMEELLERLNASLPPDMKLTMPPLTMAQRGVPPLRPAETPEEQANIDALESTAKAFEILERGIRNSESKASGDVSFGQESARRYQDFLLFSNRVMKQLLSGGDTDPAALGHAAEIRFAMMREGLVTRLKAAKDASKSLAERVVPPRKRTVASEQLVRQINRAYDEATDVGNGLYTTARESYAGLSTPPNEALQRIRELMTERTNMHPLINQMFRDFTPNLDEALTNVSALRKTLDLEDTNATKLNQEATTYLQKHPEVRNFLQGMRGINLNTRMQFGDTEDVVAGIESILGRLTSKPNGYGVEPELARSAATYLRKLLPSIQADAKVGILDQQLKSAQNAVDNISAEEMPIPMLIDFHQKLGKAMRQLGTDVNNSQTVFDLGEIDDALIRDLEFYSGEAYDVSDLAPGQLDLLAQRAAEVGNNPFFEPLRQANAFHRAKHDVFTRTFAGEAKAKNSKGALKVDPKLFGQSLFRGTADEIELRLAQVHDAVNWVNSGALSKQTGPLSEEQIAELQKTAIARLGTHDAARLDILRSMTKKVLDRNPNSETYNQVDPGRAQKWINDHEEALGEMFPAVFRDLRDAIEGRRSFDDIMDSMDSLEKNFNESTQVWRFMGIEDNPGRVIANMLGSPNNRAPNAEKNLQQLIDDINQLVATDQVGYREARAQLADVLIDKAYVYAGGANSSTPFNFQKFEDYLYQPFDNKKGPSIASILERNGLITDATFRDFRTLLRQSNQIANAMKKSGAAFNEDISDKGFLMVRTVIKAMGAMAGNLTMKGLEKVPFIGKMPGATFSVAQSGSGMASQLGVDMPQMKIKDIYKQALLDPEKFLPMMFKPAPRTESQFRKFASDIPAIFLSSGARAVQGGPDPIDVARPPLQEAQNTPPPDREPRTTAPQARVEIPPMPQIPQPQPQPTPNPQAREKYAALFPNDSTTQLLKSGIGGLA